MSFAFAAAGTGGHVYPALAVADALVASGVSRTDIVFFGGHRMEAQTVPAAGYRFVPVDIRGLQRSLSPRNLAIPKLVWRAAATIRHELTSAHSGVMTVFGGYVSVPAALAARRAGVPLFVHEQNAAPGLANRMITRLAKRSFIAFPAAAARLERAELVGNPMRPGLVELDREAMRGPARDKYGLPRDATVLGVLGGSLGAQVLNDAAARIAGDVDPGSVAILHLTGPAHLDAVRARSEQSATVWRTVAFETEMETFYAAVDLVLARSGALTISELAVTSTPAVVVPLAATNQGANAQYLAEHHGLVMVDQSEIASVPRRVAELLGDHARRRRMGERAGELALADAAGIMCQRLREAAGV